MDGQTHDVGRWDLLIAHPPCTYLSNVGNRSFSLRCTDTQKVVDRWRERAKGSVFFMRFLSANADRIAIENPIGFMSTAYRRPDQVIHPYMFAESTESPQYVTKATCLWLKSLPLLVCNVLPRPNNVEMFGRNPSGKARIWEDSYSRNGRIRSKTFPGIAKAMAEQWGGISCE